MTSDRLRRYLDRLAPKVAAELMRAFKRLERRLSRQEWLTVIEGGEEYRLRSLINAMARDLDKAAEILTRAALRASAEAAKMLAVPRARLDVVNQRAVVAAETQSALFVREVSDSTRRALQQATTRAFRDGLAPRELAKVIKPMIGLTERQSRAVLNRRLRREGDGWNAARVDKDANTYAERLRARRAMTIARTETIRASTTGQDATWKAAQDTGLLPQSAQKQWIVTPDDKLCPQCTEMTGRRALAPINGQFVTPLGLRFGPPMHPNCRCAVSISAQSLRQTRAA
jgi:hypothetical protein